MHSRAAGVEGLGDGGGDLRVTGRQLDRHAEQQRGCPWAAPYSTATDTNCVLIRAIGCSALRRTACTTAARRALRAGRLQALSR